MPKYNLGINNLSSGSMIGRMIEKIDSIVKIEKPEVAKKYGCQSISVSK